MRWQDKLTEEELAHVREWCGGTLAEFKKTREAQVKMRDRNIKQGFRVGEPCWVCRDIAHKLGIE
jgi:hypothetical protein